MNDRICEKTDSMRFSALVMQKLKLPFGLFVEWMLMVIHGEVHVDRLAYLRSGKEKRELFLAQGYGPFLPMIGSKEDTISEAMLEKLQAGGWVWNATPGVGWDAYFAFIANGRLCVLAIDDTNDERHFSREEKRYLSDAAKWFGICYEIKYEWVEDKERYNRDFITDLHNTRSCCEELIQHALSVRHGVFDQVSVAVLDLDHFKKFNDTYGHKVGDRVLQIFGGILKECGLFAGRYGGEEFVLISNQSAEHMVEQIEIVRERLGRTRVMDDNGKKIARPITFSAGVFEADRQLLSDMQTHEDAADLLFRQADKRMYVAKNLGRDRTVK